MLKNKVGLITGSGSGIGRTMAQVFATEGCKVVVSDINVAGGKETVELIRAGGGDASFCAADVGNEADARGIHNCTEKRKTCQT